MTDTTQVSAFHEPPKANPDKFALLYEAGKGGCYFRYRSVEHDLRTITAPNYFRSVIDHGISPGDRIDCVIGTDPSEATYAELVIDRVQRATGIGERGHTVTVAIIRRHKATPVRVEIGDDETAAADDGKKPGRKAA